MRLPFLLFTSQYSVKAAEPDRKCPESGQRVPVVHRQHILPNIAKLEDDLAGIGCCRLALGWVHWKELRMPRDSPTRLESGGRD